jgi:hypothetical protein
VLPYDKDLTWGSTQLKAIHPHALGVSRMLNRPYVKRIYFSYIEELIAGPYARAEVDPRVDALHAMLRAEGEKANNPKPIKEFVDQRTEWLRENVLPESVDFKVTTGSGEDFSTTASAVSLEGTAPLCVRRIELNGRPAEIHWTDVTTWKIDKVPLKPEENRIDLAAAPMPDDDKANLSVTITRK